MASSSVAITAAALILFSMRTFPPPIHQSIYFEFLIEHKDNRFMHISRRTFHFSAALTVLHFFLRQPWGSNLIC
jgi:hypothetical protein